MTDDSSDNSGDDRAGFEWRGRFYPWSVSDIGKDLMLIDRIAQIPPSDFFELVSDLDENARSPVLLGLIATSLRAGHPEWSVDKIHRLVMGLSLSADVEFVTPDTSQEEDGEADVRPPGLAAGPPTSAPGRSPSNGSSPPSTPAEPSTSATSSATPP